MFYFNDENAKCDTGCNICARLRAEKHAYVLEWRRVSVVLKKKERKKDHYQTKNLPTRLRAHGFARSSAILTGGLAAVGTRKLGFLILNHRSVILIYRHQVVVGLLDQLGGILHLNSGFRFLN